MSSRKSTIAFAVSVAAASVLVAWTYHRSSNEPQLSNKGSLVAPVGNFLQGHSDGSFEQASEVRTFEFPKDHGPHPTFESEWWYFTGNLSADNDDHYGYQFTIFRRSTTTDQHQLDSNWAGNQLYLAHIGITDVGGGNFLTDEKYSRGALDLSGSQAQPFLVWVENWRVEGIPTRCKGCLDFHIKAEADGFTFDLKLSSDKPVVLQGNQGLSPKGETPGQASYYYSLTRLSTSGKLTLNNRAIPVKGDSWMDHEWFSSALGEDDAGWDWFSLQLDDNREMMFFQIRKHSLEFQPFRYGILVGQQGDVEILHPDQIRFETLDRWKSEKSQTEYPIHWRIAIDDKDITVDIKALLNDQERDGSFRYWEGAVAVKGKDGSINVTGTGYLEMTGY